MKREPKSCTSLTRKNTKAGFATQNRIAARKKLLFLDPADRQPWPESLIPVQADSTWSTETHLGFEYAALLVEPGYRPAATMDVAPAPGGVVVAVNVVKGTGTVSLAPTKPLHFSGYDWKVRTIAGDRGGLNNLYDGDNAWTDSRGALHLFGTEDSAGTLSHHEKSRRCRRCNSRLFREGANPLEGF